MKHTTFGSLVVTLAVLAACGGHVAPSAPGPAQDPGTASILARIAPHAPKAHIMPIQKPGAAAPISTAGSFQYYGGRVISNPQVQPVFWGPSVNSTLTAGIEGFYKAVLPATSEYWAWLTEYNTKGVTPVGGGTGSDQTIGPGTVLPPVAITPSFTGTAIDDTNIQAELKAQIKAGHLPKPTADAAGNDNTYYPIFFPQGVTVTLDGEGSCSVFCAYHGTIAADATAGTPEFYYGVHMDLFPGSPCNGECGADPTPFNDQTSVASHELGEATTDAEVGLSTTIGPPLAWYDTTNGEIGDICNAQQGTLPGSTYIVQKLWSNELAQCILSKGTTSAVTATITAPAAGATVSGSVSLTATAATTFTGDTISSVAFYEGATLIGTAKASPYKVSWDTAKVKNGSYSLTAKATDSGGHSGTSAAVAVTVDNGGSCESVTDSGAGHGTLATAVALTGTCATVTGTLKAGYTPYFKAAVAAGKTLGGALTTPAGAVFLLTAFDSKGDLVGYSETQISVVNHGTATATYYLAAVPVSGTGKYTLKATY